MIGPAAAPLYHCSPALYVPGERIAPGNYGRVVEGTGFLYRAFGREYLLERVRAEEFSDKPSRLRSCFALEDQARADAFRQQQESGGVWEVLVAGELVVDQRLG